MRYEDASSALVTAKMRPGVYGDKPVPKYAVRWKTVIQDGKRRRMEDTIRVMRYRKGRIVVRSENLKTGVKGLWLRPNSEDLECPGFWELGYADKRPL